LREKQAYAEKRCFPCKAGLLLSMQTAASRPKQRPQESPSAQNETTRLAKKRRTHRRLHGKLLGPALCLQRQRVG
jgi:hypothetical protein